MATLQAEFLTTTMQGWFEQAGESVMDGDDVSMRGAGEARLGVR